MFRVGDVRMLEVEGRAPVGNRDQGSVFGI